MVTYKWVRHVTTPTQTGPPNYASGITGDISQPFAAYVDDLSFGVRTIVDPAPETEDEFHYWRHRVTVNGRFLFDIEWEFVRQNGVDYVRSRYYNFYGNISQDWSQQQTPPDIGPLILDSTLTSNGLPALPTFDLENYYLGKVKAVFQYKVGPSYSQAQIVAGGITISLVQQGIYIVPDDAGSVELGNGGFDIRTLVIDVTNLGFDKETFNPEKEPVNFRADVLAMPASTSNYPSGWEPLDPINYDAGVTSNIGKHPLIPVESDTVNKETFAAPKIAEVDFEWDGKAGNIPVTAATQVLLAISASAFNPDGDPNSTSTSRMKFDGVNMKKNCDCNLTNLTISLDTATGQAVSYTSDPEAIGALPASMGYGWSSAGSERITEQASGSLLYKFGSTNYLRWDLNNGNYIPFNPNLYIEASKNVLSADARYSLSFRNQTVRQFRADGRLNKVIDRNGNSQTYSYNSTTNFLEAVEDSRGHSIYYTHRPDGQILTSRIDDPVDGRLTQFVYYDVDAEEWEIGKLWKIINPEGEVTEFIYSGTGYLQQIYDSRGIRAKYLSHDAQGKLRVDSSYSDDPFSDILLYKMNFGNTSAKGITKTVAQEDWLNFEPYRFVTYYQDIYQRVIEIEEFIDEYYDDTINTLLEYTDPNNPYLVTKRTDPNLTSVSYEYDVRGNLTKMIDKDLNETVYTYNDGTLNPKHRDLLSSIQRPDVTVEGVLTTYLATEFDYDPDGNLEQVTDAKGKVTSMIYEDDGLVSSVTDRNGHTTNFIYEGVAFDGSRRRLLEIQVPTGTDINGGTRSVHFTYDAHDNVASVTDQLGNQIEYQYDDIDRMTQFTDARDKTTFFSYFVEPEYSRYGQALYGTATYDVEQVIDGHLHQVKLPANNGSNGNLRNVSVLYDRASRLQKITRDLDTSRNQQTIVKYGYNGFSELNAITRMKDGVEKSFRMNYDQLRRPSSVTDPLNNTSQMSYEPFCVGNSATSARGVRKASTYDNRCLLTYLEAGDPDLNDPLGVTNVRETRDFSYDELGRLVSVQQTDALSNTETRSFVYDELDRLVKITHKDGSSTSYEYDFEGNVTRITDPEGKVTEYSYYRDNLLHKVTIKRGDPEVAVGEFVYTYDPAGRLDKIVYPASADIEAVFRDEADLSVNGIGSGFDPNGNIRFLRYQKTDGTLVRRYEWTYDDSNNRQSMLDVDPSRAVLWEYGFDWLDRLITVKRAESFTGVQNLPATTLERAYVFDESDNRKFFDDFVNGVTYHYTYKSINDSGTIRYSDQLEEVLIYPNAAGHRTIGDFSTFEALLSDADGNVTRRTIAGTSEQLDYTWTDFDRLMSVESSQNGTLQEARYGADGLRDQKIDSNGNSSEEHGVGIMTLSSSPTSGSSAAPTISYIHGHMLMGAEIDGEFVYFLNDALSTVRDLVSYDQGTSEWKVLRSYEFDEYGNALPNSGNGTGPNSPKTFVGGLSVNDDTADSGMFNMGHRNYAAGVLGRFISRDPIGHAGNLNLYAYPTNPVKFVDPWGLETRLPNRNERQQILDWLISQLPENRKRRGLKPIPLDWDGANGAWACVDVYINGVDSSGVIPGPLMNTLDGTRDVKNLAETMQQATKSGGPKYYRPWDEANRALVRPGQFLILDGDHEYAHSVVVHSVKKETVRTGGGGCSRGVETERVIIDVIGLGSGGNGPEFKIIEDYETYLKGSNFTIRGFGDLPIHE